MGRRSMANAFEGCTNMTLTATDVPNLAGVTDMSAIDVALSTSPYPYPQVLIRSYMFSDCSSYNQALPSTFNTSNEMV